MIILNSFFIKFRIIKYNQIKIRKIVNIKKNQNYALSGLKQDLGAKYTTYVTSHVLKTKDEVLIVVEYNTRSSVFYVIVYYFFSNY